MKLKSILLSACLISAVNTHAVVNVTFTGTSILTVTTTQDITFTNVPTGETIYGFALLNVFPDNMSTGTSPHTGTMGWNGGGTNSNFGLMGFFDDVAVTQEDFTAIWLSGNQPATTSTMTLTAGSRTSTNSIAIGLPEGPGSFEIRLLSGNTGNFIGDAGTQVPEPGTYTTLFALATLGFVMVRRHRKA